MQRERRSLWIIIVLLFFVGLFQLMDWQSYIGIGSWDLNRTIGWSWDLQSYIWWYLVVSPGICAVVSALVYGWLHYRGRHLTLWLMTLQMLVILMVAYMPMAGAGFLIIAWLMLLSVIFRSKKAPEGPKRQDILDDI